MNNTPLFSLRWNNYVNHVTDAFNILRLDNDLVDVTLCCEGGKIKAHRILLSACSNYFRQVFKESPCQHPVIIFRNVKFGDLNAIVTFMYQGEVNIPQEQLESFLLTAELLEIRGLTDNVEDDAITKNFVVPSEEFTLDLSAKFNQIPEEFESNQTVAEPINLASMHSSRNEFVAPLILKNTSDHSENTAYDTESSKTEGISTKRETVNLSSSLNQDEMQVDNQSLTAEDLSDRNTSESELAKFRCQLCPKGFKHPTSLTLHKDSHAGKTQCPVCHRSFSRSYDMRSHLQRIHQKKHLTIKEIRYKSNDTGPKQLNL